MAILLESILDRIDRLEKALDAFLNSTMITRTQLVETKGTVCKMANFLHQKKGVCVCARVCVCVRMCFNDVLYTFLQMIRSAFETFL